MGRALGKVLETLPELNGRVVFGSFLPSRALHAGDEILTLGDGAGSAALRLTRAQSRAQAYPTK